MELRARARGRLGQVTSIVRESGARVARGFKVEFERFLQVGQGFFIGLALACDVDFLALGDVPVSVSPSGCCDWHFVSPFFERGKESKAFTRV